jgi:hypothetical protein
MKVRTVLVTFSAIAPLFFLAQLSRSLSFDPNVLGTPLAQTIPTLKPKRPLIQNIQDLKITTLPAPPFSKTQARVIKPSLKEFQLQPVSATPNSVTDQEAWFRDNNLLPLPRTILPADQPATFYDDLPNSIPLSFRGNRLIKAIRQADERILLIYGREYYQAGLLIVYDAQLRAFSAGFDFKNYAYAPENIPADREFTQQFIQWATQINHILYVAHGHNTYARSSKGMNAYITAINTQNARILWTSPTLISNARNFAVIDNYLVAGYGFTAEPDFLFVIRRNTGVVIQKIPLKSAPEYIIPKGERIYVRAYDADYVFRILRK